MKIIKNLLVGAAITATCAFASNAGATQDGPDDAGYIVSDAGDPSLYGYVNITGTGTQIITNGDDNAATVNFASGATFNFYGAQRTSFRVSANGYITTNLTDSGNDWNNDCPAAAVGTGERLYVMHDDLQGINVFTQYFAAENITVVQWVGSYWSSTGPVGSVNFEVLFYHNLHVAVVQVAQASQLGASSTMGAFSNTLNTGLTLDCNFSGYITPGSMFVAYGSLRLNEIRSEQPGADTDEYFELTGVPGFDPVGVTFLAIGDDGAGDSGRIEAVLNLSGIEFDPGGVGNVFMSIGDTTATLPGLDYLTTAPLNFEDNDNITYAIVTGFTGANNQDLDTNNDGLLDVVPWTNDIDAVSTLNSVQPPPVGQEWAYALNNQVPAGPNGNAGHVQRCGDIFGPWVAAAEDPAVGQDTPTGLNICVFCGNGQVELGEACDGDGAGNGGETAACNSDCSVSACGDGVLNTTAMEACDDGNGSNADDCPDGVNGSCQPAACGDGFLNTNGTTVEGCDDGNGSNADDCPDDAANGGTCVAATCGDGFTNTNGTLVEDCDDAGESATCNGDCSTAACGDSVVNNTAGETCDDGGRSATCDNDCTAVSCGDGVVNMTSGEVCDGDGAGNAGETATCDTDCTAAECGDGVVNGLAGETCDDTAESLTCDGDCTAVSCGDGELNTTAGEECDDGNTTAGDGCDANCLTEGGMGGMGAGGMGSGGMAAGGSAAGGSAAGGSAAGGMGAGGNSSGSGASSNEDDDPTVADSGCGCSVPGDNSPNGAAALALLLGVGVMVSRRRRSA